jgi:hypothetical protein
VEAAPGPPARPRIAATPVARGVTTATIRDAASGPAPATKAAVDPANVAAGPLTWTLSTDFFREVFFFNFVLTSVNIELTSGHFESTFKMCRNHGSFYFLTAFEHSDLCVSTCAVHKQLSSVSVYQ